MFNMVLVMVSSCFHDILYLHWQLIPQLNIIVGSKFKEPTYAEMSRAYDKSIGEEQQGAVQMLIPHTVRRHVVARLVESHIAGLDLNFDYSEKQLSAKRAASNNVDEDCKSNSDVYEASTRNVLFTCAQY
jgi:hypothetical protein